MSRIGEPRLPAAESKQKVTKETKIQVCRNRKILRYLRFLLLGKKWRAERRDTSALRLAGAFRSSVYAVRVRLTEARLQRAGFMQGSREEARCS
jgi:hypothetical protein